MHPFIDLQNLADKLLTPRELVRDEQGYLFHPDLPVLDESVRIDHFLSAFGLETAFVGMETDCPDDPRTEAYFDGDADCNWWTPTTPEGEGWVIVDIYDTESGPYSFFVRRKQEQPAVRRGRRRDKEEAMSLGGDLSQQERRALDFAVSFIESKAEEHERPYAQVLLDMYKRLDR